ncbi:hypothetical protein [Pseudomarimonas arenosa]|uniref:Lipoprotein n=1 Tax=Pseudomarimonas arenosa TaxID=2774145 RepID=A0AAW3ZRN7_9GAMM|nr:hypothetical protein [Pseudomarimonas arenosa]MBD8527212.1 hypothetical protein [Pseudomarimonas arenosa]
MLNRSKMSAALMAALLAGCASAPVQTVQNDARLDRMLDGHSPRMQRVLTDMYQQGEWNAVLNLGRAAHLALEEGDTATAARALDMAILRVESVYADNESAKKARSVWSKEAIKDFKGEPHERSMLYFYRGLVDLAEGDYENARAMFRSAEYQDTLSEAESYQSDFALMNWMSGWASQCAGDSSSAEEGFSLAKAQLQARADSGAEWETKLIESNGEIAPVADATRLQVFELGRGPTKYAGGKNNELLMFTYGALSEPREWALGPDVESLRPDEKTNGWMAESLGYQATTRGGRQVDSVLAGKANFKNNAETVGQVAQDVGTAAMYAGAFSGNDDLMGAGAAVALIGLFSSAMAAAADPDADKRALGLPELLFAGAAPPSDKLFSRPSEGGEWTLVEPVFTAEAGKCSIEIYRDQEASNVALNGQFVLDPLTDRERRKLMKKNSARDTAFRNEITSLFERPLSPPAEAPADAESLTNQID